MNKLCARCGSPARFAVPVGLHDEDEPVCGRCLTFIDEVDMWEREIAEEIRCGRLTFPQAQGLGEALEMSLAEKTVKPCINF